jgi:hypothetical protein
MTITSAGLAEAAGLVGDTGSPTAFTALAYGTGTTAAAATQTALVTEVARAAATVTRTTTTYTNDTLQLSYAFTVGGTYSVIEYGVFNNATSGGTMLARTKQDSAKSCTSGDTLTVTYKIAFA